jgi:hypothetical protein
LRSLEYQTDLEKWPDRSILEFFNSIGHQEPFNRPKITPGNGYSSGIADLPDENAGNFWSVAFRACLKMRDASNASRLHSHLLNYRLCDFVRLYVAHFNKLRVQE